MADDFDVEAMLEAPFRQDGNSTRDRDKHRDRDGKRDRDRDRRGSRSRDRRKSRDRDKRRSRDRDRKRSRSRDRRKGRDHRADRRRSRSRSKSRERERERERERRKRLVEMTPEERDARTVFCMQLAARIRSRDLEEFFSSVGKVRDVRIITDNKTRRSKGIAYIEFEEVDSVPLALGLSGQRLVGVPIMVQASQAEKNRSMMSTMTYDSAFANVNGPMRLYVGSLHFNITEDMLKGIFEPFGKITQVTLMKDSETGRSKGFGFLTFQHAEDAKKALEQLNGFELAGRPMKVGHVTEKTAGDFGGGSFFDNDEMDRAGVDLGATGRLQLMAKLAEGTGFQIPQAAANALNMPGQLGAPPQPVGVSVAAQHTTPPIATQCFMLSNMFDPGSETTPNWDTEVRDDVIEECNKHGGVLHIYVDKASKQGNVYVKCPTITAAAASVNALHGRFFAGRVITAAYVPLPNYHQLFSDALRATNLLMPSSTKSFGAAPAMPFIQR